jgi:hypothetical protein
MTIRRSLIIKLEEGASLLKLRAEDMLLGDQLGEGGADDDIVIIISCCAVFDVRWRAPSHQKSRVLVLHRQKVARLLHGTTTTIYPSFRLPDKYA